MEVSPRFTTQFRDTTLNGATRTARNQQLKLEKQQLHKQQIRHDEENRINDLRSKHTLNTKQKKAFHTKQSNKNSTTIGEENNAATNIQARWRGKSERLESSTPNYSTIVQTVENEENVRSRQLAANNADIQRHRTAAASGAAFRKRGSGPTTTMQMTTGRDGTSPTRPSRPNAERRRRIAAPSARLTRPGRRTIPQRKKNVGRIPTPRRVRLSAKQKKRATRASKRGAPEQWALQKKKAQQHALFTKIKREMLAAGHDPAVVHNNALIAAKKVIVKREREQLKKEARELEEYERAEKKRDDMQKKTKEAAAKKWQERQHRLTAVPVGSAGLWGPSSGGGGGSDGDGAEDGDASFLLGPVPKKQLPVRKSFRSRKSPKWQQQQLKQFKQLKRPSTGIGRSVTKSRRSPSPQRPSTSGNQRRTRQPSRPTENAETDFPSRPETLSATSIFEEQQRRPSSNSSDDGILEVEENARDAIAAADALLNTNSNKFEQKRNVRNVENVEKVIVQKEKKENKEVEEEEEEDDYGDDDYEDDDGFEDDFEDVETVEKTKTVTKPIEKEMPPPPPPIMKTKKKVGTTYHQPKPIQKEVAPVDPNEPIEWTCKCGFDNDLTEAACMLCGATQSNKSNGSTFSTSSSSKSEKLDPFDRPVKKVDVSPSKEELKQQQKEQLLQEMQREDSITSKTSSPKINPKMEPVLSTHSYGSLDADDDDEDEDDDIDGYESGDKSYLDESDDEEFEF